MADARIELVHHEKHVVNLMEWRASRIRRGEEHACCRSLFHD